MFSASVSCERLSGGEGSDWFIDVNEGGYGRTLKQNRRAYGTRLFYPQAADKRPQGGREGGRSNQTRATFLTFLQETWMHERQ